MQALIRITKTINTKRNNGKRTIKAKTQQAANNQKEKTVAWEIILRNNKIYCKRRARNAKERVTERLRENISTQRIIKAKMKKEIINGVKFLIKEFI